MPSKKKILQKQPTKMILVNISKGFKLLSKLLLFGAAEFPNKVLPDFTNQVYPKLVNKCLLKAGQMSAKALFFVGRINLIVDILPNLA